MARSGQARRGEARSGKARQGIYRYYFDFLAWLGGVWRGLAGSGSVRQGKARIHIAIILILRLGLAWLGLVWRGKARQGYKNTKGRIKMIKNMKVTDLVMDFEFYPRNEISSENVTRLMDAVKTGVMLPPIIVDKKTKRVGDGFHRLRAFQKLNLETIQADLREYKSDAEFYEAAVAANTTHGRALDSYDLRRIIERMLELGFVREKIEEVIKIPPVKFDTLRRNSAFNEDGNIIPLKRGLEHLQHIELSDKQRKAVEGYGGMNATFYARQITSLLENKMLKATPEFILTLDHLVELWEVEREFYVVKNQAVAA